MSRIEQRAVLGQTALVPGHLDPVAGGHDGVQRDAYFDSSPHKARVDRVVVRLDAHIVVPGQPGRKAPGGVGCHRREGAHGPSVLIDQLGRHRSGRRVHPAVRSLQPRGELDVEIIDVTEAPSGQEGGLVVAVGPFVHPLGLGVVGFAQPGPHAERAPEALVLRGVALLAPAPLPDAALAVPHRGARDGPDLDQALEHAGQHVMGRPGWHHPRRHEARVAADRGDHPELLGQVEADRDGGFGLPQVELDHLARGVGGALARIGGQEQRAQLGHSVAQDGDAVLPADALGDHRGGHRRGLL
jgi:hypothetical protein